jgi:aryl-alcohol dehydrogenase-like predicted oxidoreductase
MQRVLGSSGIRVYPIGLGAMPLSLSGRPDEATAIGVIKAALDAGVDFIDTANSYCIDQNDVGHNERLIAKALKKLGAAGKVTVATKGGMIRPGGAWNMEGRPAELIKACEKSLVDLGVDTITLYQLHGPDPRVAFADSVGALAQLQQQGKIRHIGLSNVDVAQIQQAQRAVAVVSVQNECNVQERGDLRNGVLKYCAQQNIAYIAYSPVGGYWGHGRLAQNRTLLELGRKHGVSPQRIMLDWLLSLGEHVLPIPGASKARSIQDSAQAANLKLGPEDLKKLERI